MRRGRKEGGAGTGTGGGCGQKNGKETEEKAAVKDAVAYCSHGSAYPMATLYGRSERSSHRFSLGLASSLRAAMNVALATSPSSANS